MGINRGYSPSLGEAFPKESNVLLSERRVPMIKTAILVYDGDHRGASEEFNNRPQWKTTAKRCCV